MGKYSEICKIMKDLDHKYHMDENADNKELADDALIKHLEEEYKKEQESDKSK